MFKNGQLDDFVAVFVASYKMSAIFIAYFENGIFLIQARLISILFVSGERLLHF